MNLITSNIVLHKHNIYKHNINLNIILVYYLGFLVAQVVKNSPAMCFCFFSFIYTKLKYINRN